MGRLRSVILLSLPCPLQTFHTSATIACRPSLPGVSATTAPVLHSLLECPPLPRSAHSNPSRSPVLVPKSLEVSSPNFRKPRDMQTLPTRDRELEGDQKAPLEAGRPCGDRVCSQRARGAELTFLMSLDQVPREPP